MISENQIEQLVERLVDRIEQANLVFLEEIGKNIKKIESISPSEAHKLINILKYGTSYNDIVYKISQLTNLNIEEIDKIFHTYAEKDRNFYKRFYEYRNLLFQPYQENTALRNQVQALANITKNELANFMNTRALGYSAKDLNGNVVFKGLRDVYTQVLDEAILNVGQGKETFDTAMRNTLKQLGGSGLKTIDYQGRTMRLDSAIRMNMQGALRNLHNETQKIYGQEFGANMVEVSHHSNSAPDHIDSVDGKQFARINVIKEQIASGIEKEIKLSDIVENRVKIKGKWYDDFDYINDNLDRPVGQLNCYHYTFEGILGISQPQYTEEQLKADKEKNEKGCIIDGKHYTLYETTQLLRSLELQARKCKDIHTLARMSGNDDLILEMQQQLTQINTKYSEIVKISGLPSKKSRMSVSGYKRVAIKSKK